MQTTQPAPAASAVGPCPTVIKVVGRPGTGRLPSTIAPPDHPQNMIETDTLMSTRDILFSIYKKKVIILNYPKSTATGFSPRDLRIISK